MKAKITINGITKEIELTPEQVAQFEKPKVQKPRYGESYYFIDDFGEIVQGTWVNLDVYNARYALDIIAKTKEECEFIRKKMIITKQLQDYADEHNGTDRLAVYHIGWDFDDEKVIVRSCFGYKFVGVTFSRGEIAEAAVKAVGEDRVKKYYLGVEEWK